MKADTVRVHWKDGEQDGWSDLDGSTPCQVKTTEGGYGGLALRVETHTVPIRECVSSTVSEHVTVEIDGRGRGVWVETRADQRVRLAVIAERERIASLLADSLGVDRAKLLEIFSRK